MAVKKEIEETVLFTKKSILESKKYINHRDLLSVLLLDSECYTETEVNKKIDNFLKGKVE